MTASELITGSVYREMKDGERETIGEAVGFYLDFWIDHLDHVPDEPDYEFVERHIATCVKILAVIEGE